MRDRVFHADCANQYPHIYNIYIVALRSLLSVYMCMRIYVCIVNQRAQKEHIVRFCFSLYSFIYRLCEKKRKKKRFNALRYTVVNIVRVVTNYRKIKRESALMFASPIRS